MNLPERPINLCCYHRALVGERYPASLANATERIFIARDLGVAQSMHVYALRQQQSVSIAKAFAKAFLP